MTYVAEIRIGQSANRFDAIDRARQIFKARLESRQLKVLRMWQRTAPENELHIYIYADVEKAAAS